MSDIYRLADEVSAYGNLPAEYIEKMLHKIPPAPVYDRVDFLRLAVKGKTVLDVGASGPLAEVLQKAAKTYHGTDIVPNPAIKHFHVVDLEQASELPYVPDLDLIVAGEVIEHLSNAGRFLDLLHGCAVPVILTTPNAFASAGRTFLKREVECVNKQHVAWYSYHTLKVLTERHGFKIVTWGWYNGQRVTAEGLIFSMEPVDGTA